MHTIGEVIEGYATPYGTRKYVDYSVKKMYKPLEHFRIFDKLYLSSLGIGTYRGDLSKTEDKLMENAIYESIKSGCINVLDTAINYRSMRSEKVIGHALSRAIEDNIISRDEIFISTKNGYITSDHEDSEKNVMDYIEERFISKGTIELKDISPSYNTLNSHYIEKCIDKSLSNMKITTIDLVYIHNSYENWHNYITKEEYIKKLSKIFEIYEKYRANNKIRYYGMATWTCFRVPENKKDYLSLEEIVKTAEDVYTSSGDVDKEKRHGFRFIQLPYNLSLTEPLLLKNQSIGNGKNLSILEAASKLSIGVFASSPFFHGLLFGVNIPKYSKGLNNQSSKLLQIIRSSPSIIAPLIGQKKKEHLVQNFEISNIPPMNKNEFSKAIDSILH
jgi:aryl-alcohol dehydrogenase-like predicted oxidoreductase